MTVLPLQELKSPFLDKKMSLLKSKKSRDISSLVNNVLTLCAEDNSALNKQMGALIRKSNNHFTSKLAKSLADNIVFSATSSSIGKS